MPIASSDVSTAIEQHRAPVERRPPPTDAVGLTVMPNWPSTVCRYSDQPLATTDAPSANSRTRSQPMIQATNSPKVA